MGNLCTFGHLSHPKPDAHPPFGYCYKVIEALHTVQCSSFDHDSGQGRIAVMASWCEVFVCSLVSF